MAFGSKEQKKGIEKNHWPKKRIKKVIQLIWNLIQKKGIEKMDR
jgi:hypothetical protein